jgi:hypothetical protein
VIGGRTNLKEHGLPSATAMCFLVEPKGPPLPRVSSSPCGSFRLRLMRSALASRNNPSKRWENTVLVEMGILVGELGRRTATFTSKPAERPKNVVRPSSRGQSSARAGGVLPTPLNQRASSASFSGGSTLAKELLRRRRAANFGTLHPPEAKAPRIAAFGSGA